MDSAGPLALPSHTPASKRSPGGSGDVAGVSAHSLAENRRDVSPYRDALLQNLQRWYVRCTAADAPTKRVPSKNFDPSPPPPEHFRVSTFGTAARNPAVYKENPPSGSENDETLPPKMSPRVEKNVLQGPTIPTARRFDDHLRPQSARGTKETKGGQLVESTETLQTGGAASARPASARHAFGVGVGISSALDLAAQQKPRNPNPPGPGDYDPHWAPRQRAPAVTFCKSARSANIVLKSNSLLFSSSRDTEAESGRPAAYQLPSTLSTKGPRFTSSPRSTAAAPVPTHDHDAAEEREEEKRKNEYASRGVTIGRARRDGGYQLYKGALVFHEPTSIGTPGVGAYNIEPTDRPAARRVEKSSNEGHGHPLMPPAKPAPPPLPGPGDYNPHLTKRCHNRYLQAATIHRRRRLRLTPEPPTADQRAKRPADAEA